MSTVAELGPFRDPAPRCPPMPQIPCAADPRPAGGPGRRGGRQRLPATRADTRLLRPALGEAAALRTGRVDCLRGRLQIVESVAEVNGRIVFGSPKSHEHRWVTVPRFLRDELIGATAGKSPGDLVFASPTGTVLRLSNSGADQAPFPASRRVANRSLTCGSAGAPGRIRTCDARFRKGSRGSRRPVVRVLHMPMTCGNP